MPFFTSVAGTITNALKSTTLPAPGIRTSSGYRPFSPGASHVHLFGPVAVSAPWGAFRENRREAGAAIASGIFS